MLPLTLLWLFFLIHVALAAPLEVVPGSLRTNGRINPLGTDITVPRIDWQLSSSTNGVLQSSYRLIASLNPQPASQSIDDLLWDSGEVSSNISSTKWSGPPLASRQRVYWQVQASGISDGSNMTTSWSEVAWFEMGLLAESDWVEASWIENSAYAPSGNTSLPIFAVDFNNRCEAGAVSSARLYLCGLGIHVATINGESVGIEALAPGYSVFNTSVEYSTYDVTQLLKNGTNVLGVELGKGLWNTATPLAGRYTDHVTKNLRVLKMICILEYVCKGSSNSENERTVVASSTDWKTSVDGPYLESAWWGGDAYDARKEMEGWNLPGYDYSNWTMATVSEPPGGVLIAQEAPQIQAIGDPIEAKSVANIGNGTYVFDMGINFAGWYEITMRGQRDQVATIRPAEKIHSAGTIDQSTGGSPTFDTYTFKSSDPEVHSPKFRYQGFRYLQVENLQHAPSTSDLKSHVLRAANAAVGTFNTSETLFEQIHGLVDRAIQSNMYSTLTDCPTRERMGWLEATHFIYTPIQHFYDVDAYTRSILRKISESQEWNGLIPPVAPDYPDVQVLDVNWGDSIILVPLAHYKAYGDPQILTTYYQSMVNYMQWLAMNVAAPSYEPLRGGYGDWEATDTTTNKNMSSVWGYQKSALAMAEIAELIGEDPTRWNELAQAIRASFNSTFLLTNESTTYGSGSQASDLFALDIGAVTESMRDNVTAHLLASIEAASNHSTVGEIALPPWFQILTDIGRTDLIYEWLKKTDQPSYGNFVTTGATSLPELWTGTSGSGSQNHFILGVVDKWFIENLVGLQQRNGTVAFRDLVISPTVVGDVTYAATTHVAKHGQINVSWVLEPVDGKFGMEVVVPVGSQAEVRIPAKDVVENGKSLQAGINGVQSITASGGGLTIVQVGSGKYSFSGTFTSI